MRVLYMERGTGYSLEIFYIIKNIRKKVACPLLKIASTIHHSPTLGIQVRSWNTAIRKVMSFIGS